ncbi:MAG: amidohydrolase family protein [Candidatus Latescibacterota bacterium]|nr:amidohydrolase family protein [Candidatus Latescibacterota bacterium]
MIIDSHTHAWEYWPYEPSVPDHESRGRAENLLYEMDRHGVDQAVLVCARIDHNPNDNGYVAEVVKQYPDRFIQFADVDCSWMDSYHTPGAADRLRQAAEKYQLRGFTHYLKSDFEWFASDEGIAFLEVAAELKLIVSLAGGHQWQPALRELATRFDTVTLLCHHMAGARVSNPQNLTEIVKSAKVPNISIKMSGFHYVSQTSWEYPYPDTHDTVKELYDAFGPDRLCWGSDYPVVRSYMTYQHAIEVFRTHCDFIPEADREKILGLSLKRFLDASGPSG